MADLILPRERLELALTRITVAQREALEKAAARVRSYHEKQKQDSWSYTEADGTVLGQKVTPLDRAGLYVPGGKASYPSSVLMNAIPAKVAGVAEVVMVVPTPRGEINELVLAAACIAGVDRVFTIGGAQASPRWPTAPKACRRWTKSSARATSTSPPPSATCSVRSAST
jgi:histidinol dehydrogenase